MPTTLLGLPTEIAMMFGASLLYIIGIAVTWRTYRGEPNELMTAFMAFLVSMALALSLMAAAMLWGIPMLGMLGTVAILVGSVIMLRFPLSYLDPTKRSTMFAVSSVLAFLFLFFMMVVPAGQRLMADLVMWFMIIVNGVVVSLFMIQVGLVAQERWFKVKTIGGGAGIASCCFVSHIAALLGMVTVMAVFQFMAPIIIASSIHLGKWLQKKQQPHILHGILFFLPRARSRQ